MTRILVWGCGGHGKVVADLVRATGAELIGFADAAPEKLGEIGEPGGARVIVSEEELIALLAADESLPAGAQFVAIALGNNRRRLEVCELLGERVAPPLIHPSAVVSSSVALGRGTVVFARVVVNAATSVGAAVILNTGAIVEHDCVVGDGVHVSPSATLCGSVAVGPCSWIGANATVIQSVHIGAGVRVGAGAVVVRDVADDVTVTGVPASSRVVA